VIRISEVGWRTAFCSASEFYTLYVHLKCLVEVAISVVTFFKIYFNSIDLFII